MVSNFNKYVKIYSQLVKTAVSFPVSILCFCGYVLYSGSIDSNVWLSCVGVFLLSGASSAANQLMEIKYDALMERTYRRPLPSGTISSKMVIYLVVVQLIVGAGLLYTYSVVAAILGLLAVVWYLGVYTLLKRKTAFATIPGALIGALPILIGWTAAGGSITNEKALLVSFFVFLWQIPHFWLLMMMYKDDYQKAGYPTLQETFSGKNLNLWTLGWIITLSVSSLLMLMKGYVKPNFVIAFYIFNVALIVYAAFILLNSQKKVKPLFHNLNYYVLVIIVLLLLEF